MKILQVCSAESLGGGERHVMDLAASLIERGHELHLAVRPGCPLIEEMDGLPVVWHEMSLRNAMDVISAGALASVIREHSIDVMHAHVARKRHPSIVGPGQKAVRDYFDDRCGAIRRRIPGEKVQE